jgi:hypothetical protein
MLLFMDGQAHYDTAGIAKKYSSLPLAFVTWSVVAEGRFGNCIKRVSTSNAGGAGYLGIAPLMTRLGPWTPTTSGVCGFAIKVDDVSRASVSTLGGNPDGLLSIWEGSTFHLVLYLNPNGTFTLARNEASGFGGMIPIAVSSEGLANGVWMFVECKWVIHPTAGTFAVRVNGVPVLDFAGKTTENTINVTLGVWNAVRVAGVTSQAGAPPLTIRLCDLYLADLNATFTDDVHDFLGDGTIVTIMPNAAGDATGWVPPAGANWDAVNDRPAPDDDATYVATANLGVLDLYNFENIPAGAIVKGAHINIMARKETEGAATVAPLVQPPGSGTITGPAQGVTTLVYDHYITQAYDLNPASGVKFTADDINNGQFGVVKTT